jgi:hypothetical protein
VRLPGHGGVCYRIPGISSIRGSLARQRQLKASLNQCLTSQFPTHLNREFFWALLGIESDHQGTFRPEQGILLWPTIGQIPNGEERTPIGRRRYRRLGEGRDPRLAFTQERRGPPATRSAGWVWDARWCFCKECPGLQPRGPHFDSLAGVNREFSGLTGNETNPQGSSGQIGENLEPMMGRSTRSFACVERCRCAQSQKLLEFA